MPRAYGAAAAKLIVRSDMRGRMTHGVARLASYVEMMNQGLLPRPKMSHETRGGAIVFEADGALGHVAAPEIIALALGALKTQASVLVVVREIGHLGSLGIHALAAAEAGAFCLVGQQAPPVMAMRGFREAALGNNPIAFAAPMPNADPLVFDMACSEAARGHILLAAREGGRFRRTGPWTSRASRPPIRSARSEALLPAGGHKGMGIAMLVEVIAAALGANPASMARPRPQAREGGGSSRVGAFFWFVDPGAFGSRALFDSYMTQWTGFYLASGPDAGRLPGQRAAELERVALAAGIVLSDATVRELRMLGDNLGVPFPA